MASELLVFHIDTGRFGIPSSQVREVLRAVTISPAADAPPTVLGVINLRGQVVAVVDGRRLLNIPDKQVSYTDHLIVVEVAGRLLAVRVDRAVELVAVEDAEGPRAGGDAAGTAGQRFAKTAAGLVQLVDLDRGIAAANAALPETDALSTRAETR